MRLLEATAAGGATAGGAVRRWWLRNFAGARLRLALVLRVVHIDRYVTLALVDNGSFT